MRVAPVWMGHLVAVIGSLGIAFYAVFNVLFSDVFTVSAKFGATIYVAVVYLIWSVLLHWVWPGRRAWRWWLLTPAIIFALAVAAKDRERYGYITAVVLSVAIGTYGGWWIGLRRAKRLGL